MTTVTNTDTTPSNIRSEQPIKKDYYDIIAGLSAFEKSQDVVLTREELVELTTVDTVEDNKKKEDKDEKKEEEGEEVKEPRKRHRQNLHSYLGGKVDMSEIQTAQHNLSHTLLGAYVPKKQLESLSSLDFAQYFHKALECEESLHIYDLFIQPTQNKIQNSILLNNAMNISMANTPEISESDPAHNPKVYQWTKPDGKIVRKVVICNHCHSRFFGQNRMKQLAQHHCKNDI
ncbi:hypothetical protein C6P44_002241 [Monosporozyma unispora]|nr:hypothetical protein C6P44_002241 [Kazachstania unispora]